MQTQIDHTVPEGAWTFDSGVADVFDNMLSRSIPLYEEMRKACFDLASVYIRDESAVIDLGCSRGEAIAALSSRYPNVKFIGIDVSGPMLEAAKARFKSEIERGSVEIRELDLRTAYPEEIASVTLCVLSLQFVPIEHRQKIVRDIYKHTVPGGALILVEKVLGETAEIDACMVDIYYKRKRQNGYSEEEIQRKRLSLEGVLVPITAHWNEELLKVAGFSQVDCFYRWMNFAGWVAVK